jgi:uncharacterized protein involved in outer membrane biogenesis
VRRVLIVVVALVVVVVALVFFGLRTLESASGTSKIASALSNTLGQRVTIGGINVSLFPPALDASNIQVGEAGQDKNAAPGVTLNGLHVVPELFSFLPGRTPTVDRIDLVGLTVAARRDKTGKWLIPVPASGGGGTNAGAAASSGGGSSAGGGITIKDLRVTGGTIRVVDDSLTTAGGGPTITQITNVAAQLQSAGGTITVPNFSGTLGQTSLTGNAAMGTDGIMLHLAVPSVANADLPSLFALAGMAPMQGLSIGGTSPVDVTTTIGSDMQTFTVKGTAGFDRFNLNSIALTHVKSPFSFVKKVFTLDPMVFDLYGGHETGTVAVDMNKTPMAFSIKSKIAGLDVNQALSATTTMKDKVTGTAQLTANVRGAGTSQPAIEKTLAGTMAFAVTNGVLHNFPLMATINSALGAIGKGGSSPELAYQSLSGTATIANGKATTNDLALKSDEVTMTGAGTYGFDQSLNFKFKAGLSQAASSQIAGKASFASRLTDSQGQITFPVTVTGTASSPKFGVDVKQAATQQVKGLLNQFLKKP